MSLFNLTHKSVVIKFSDSTKNQFDPTFSYIFRLTGVDGMGFLKIQDVKPGTDGRHETTSEPYWINKDLILELREFTPTNASNVRFSGQPLKTVGPKGTVDASVTKAPKAKAAPKTKIAVS